MNSYIDLYSNFKLRLIRDKQFIPKSEHFFYEQKKQKYNISFSNKIFIRISILFQMKTI